MAQQQIEGKSQEFWSAVANGNQGDASVALSTLSASEGRISTLSRLSEESSSKSDKGQAIVGVYFLLKECKNEKESWAVLSRVSPGFIDSLNINDLDQLSKIQGASSHFTQLLDSCSKGKDAQLARRAESLRPFISSEMDAASLEAQNPSQTFKDRAPMLSEIQTNFISRSVREAVSLREAVPAKTAEVPFVPIDGNEFTRPSERKDITLPEWAMSMHGHNKDTVLEGMSDYNNGLTDNIHGKLSPYWAGRYISTLDYNMTHPTKSDGTKNTFYYSLWSNIVGPTGGEAEIGRKAQECLSLLQKGDFKSAFKDSLKDEYGVNFVKLLNQLRTRTLLATEGDLTLRFQRDELKGLDFIYIQAKKLMYVAEQFEFVEGVGIRQVGVQTSRGTGSISALAGRTFTIFDGRRFIVAGGPELEGSDVKFQFYGAIDLTTNARLNFGELSASYEKSLQNQKQTLGLRLKSPEIPLGKGFFFRLDGGYDAFRWQKSIIKSFGDDLLKTQGAADRYYGDIAFVKKDSWFFKRIEAKIGQYLLYEPREGTLRFDVTKRPEGGLSTTINLGKGLDLRLDLEGRVTSDDRLNLGVRAGLSIPVDLKKD